MMMAVVMTTAAVVTAAARGVEKGAASVANRTRRKNHGC